MTEIIKIKSPNMYSGEKNITVIYVKNVKLKRNFVQIKN